MVLLLKKNEPDTKRQSKSRSDNAHKESLIHEDALNHFAGGAHRLQDPDVSGLLDHGHCEGTEQVERCNADDETQNNERHPSFDLHDGIQLPVEIVPCQHPESGSRLLHEGILHCIGSVDIVQPDFQAVDAVLVSKQTLGCLESNIRIICIVFLVVRFKDPCYNEAADQGLSGLEKLGE